MQEFSFLCDRSIRRTVKFWLSFFGCDVQKGRDWEFIMYMYIRCYIGNGQTAK